MHTARATHVYEEPSHQEPVYEQINLDEPHLDPNVAYAGTGVHIRMDTNEAYNNIIYP